MERRAISRDSAAPDRSGNGNRRLPGSGARGRRSSGAVYLADDLALQRRVALKILAPELARDPRFRDRFLRVSRLAASLEHPNIVPIHGAGESGEFAYLAMRYVEGRDLKHMIETSGAIEPQRAVTIIQQVAAALDTAHEEGLIHRDVKPGNILLGKGRTGDHVYLCDFGLAKHSTTAASLSREGVFVGTVDYVGPEQIRGDEIDGRADLYALGCVLFECLAGTSPFARNSELAVVHAHLALPPPRVTDANPDVPEAFDHVLAGALAKEPDARYRTCSEFAAAAGAALAGNEPVLPSGARAAEPALRTFMFADVRSYTKFTREKGDEAAGHLAANFAAIVDSVVLAHKGVLQKLRGDEALVVFDSARDALRCREEERDAATTELAVRLANRDVPVAVYGYFMTPEFFSGRIGCKIFPPFGYGVDLAAMCLDED